MDNQTKPKLLFFQYRYDEHLPQFLLNHARDHVKCLAEFFDVTVINEDCDYQQICDTYEPDLALFESGLDNLTCVKSKITNASACSHIPKLGLHNADAFSGARAGFLSDMHHLGIETFFSISVTAAEHTPEIADNLFVWPNFVDAAIYRDYGERKTIPVFLTGNTTSFYPWRKKIFRLVSEHFPSLLSPHPGYESGSSLVKFMHGENYARTINASTIVPACGTIAKEVVRKHFEIPACKACLVTEKSSALEAAGFVDMQNCVFVDAHDVLDKLAYLFRNPEQNERITDAGYQLVHSRHTMKQRDQIRQWFELNKNLRSDQKIIQVNPFEPLVIALKSESSRHSHVMCNGVHLKLIHQGYERLEEGRYDEAENLYLRCLNYMRWMPEARLGLTLCYLYKGNAKKAVSFIEQSIIYILERYKAVDPDPVEWAYFIICLLCLGKTDDAFKLANQFPGLRHPELDRSRWVANVSKKMSRGAFLPLDDTASGRWTIHPLVTRGRKEWFQHVCIMLTACGQSAILDSLQDAIRLENVPSRKTQRKSHDNHAIFLRQDEARNRKWSWKFPVPRPFENTSWFLKQGQVFRKLGLPLKRFCAGILHYLEIKYGYFLPYEFSEMRNDEFYSILRKLMREEEIRSALLIGGARGDGFTEAFLSGALENEHHPVKFCICDSSRGLLTFRQTLGSHAAVESSVLPSGPQERSWAAFENAIQVAMRKNRIDFFDTLLIDSSGSRNRLGVDGNLCKYIDGARLILLNAIDNPYNFEIHHRLLHDPRYLLLADNPGLRGGYSIFRKRNDKNMFSTSYSETATSGA